MDRNLIRKLELFVFVTTMLFALMGCFSFSKNPTGETSNGPSRAQYENDDALLQKWQISLDAKDYMTVNNEIYQYLSTLPQSQHWYAIMFTYGKAKEGIEDWTGALHIYEQIVDRSTDRQMEFVALALYRKAFCYEVLLENEKALASLTDAARLHSYLPLEITMAEIPARIASVHARLNQPILADRFTQKAEKGVNQVRAIKKNADPEWLSRTLVKMGSISLTQIDEESFRQNVLTLSRNQRYLIQAIELSHPSWAPEAQKTLLMTYTNLWTFIENYKLAPSKDWEADLVNEAKKKSDFLSWYLEAIEKLKSFEAPEESNSFVKTADIYYQIKLLEAKALALLNQELLKKPWNQPFKRSAASTKPSLKASEAANLFEFENFEKPENMPSSLPKKKTK